MVVMMLKKEVNSYNPERDRKTFIFRVIFLVFKFFQLPNLQLYTEKILNSLKIIYFIKM